MGKKLVIGGAAAGLIAVVGMVGAVSAEQTMPNPSLSEAQAIEIALNAVPGEVQESELEREDGATVYEIEILTAEGVEMEVEIDADTGDVLEVEVEHDYD